jgi:predicted YcjX-like family ATPase
MTARADLAAITEEIRLATAALGEFGAGLINPTVRLGVTGLSGAGKTVFITALVHQLLHGGRLPVFEALTSGRIARARLEPQPDDAVPRFDYEAHLHALTSSGAGRNRPAAPVNCASSSTISRRAARRNRTLTLDIVDYPGEWLLDLPLLTTRYAQWSADTLRLSRTARVRCWRRHGTAILRRSTRRLPRTSSPRARPRGCSPDYLGPAATIASRCACCRPDAS